MNITNDDKVLIPVMKDLQEQYGSKIISASFDKVFWSPQNLIDLEKIVKLACLPKKEGVARWIVNEKGLLNLERPANGILE